MERQLPIYEIDGTPFHVDMEHGEFREVLNPGNRIPFDEMLFKGNHYELVYDRETKNAYQGALDDAVGMESVTVVKIPHPYKLDPDIRARVLERIGSGLKQHTQPDGTTANKRISR
ncbi:hypothetical protein GCM10011386_26900 [Parapedobacter defluvii]|uniref:Uncharacterized protein n=1 Tax=Parapedobacter defluvii TaxID=2045106 RepID=A0ABQ1M2V6_9SPHI|nr:hypothetical protein [Parapedobacter defluvii]GGC33429.1 hypothetical protein GCM10011386_26900 [Parapedobacter defluvii]